MTYHRILLHLLLVFSINIGLLGQNKPPVKHCRITIVGNGTEAQYQAALAWRNSSEYRALYNGGRASQPIQWKKLYSTTASYGGYSQPSSHGGYSRPTTGPTPIITPRPRVTCRVLHSANKMRVFTDTKGGKVEGRLLSINSVNKTARIRTIKGLCYNVPISKFCSSDISFLKSWWNRRNPKKKS